MKKNSKLLTADPIFIDNQNKIAKYFISKDRGKNVRKKNEYLNLIKSSFKKFKIKITHQSFPPYTWFSSICIK